VTWWLEGRRVRVGRSSASTFFVSGNERTGVARKEAQVTSLFGDAFRLKEFSEERSRVGGSEVGGLLLITGPGSHLHV